jgi:hypothetical protein
LVGEKYTITLKDTQYDSDREWVVVHP